NSDDAKINLNLSRVRAGQQTAQTASADGRFIHSGVNAALVHIRCKYSKQLADRAEAAHQTVPKITIHPVGQTRARPGESDNRSRVQLIDPHLVCEESEQCGLCVLKWINFCSSISILLASFAIKPNAERDPTANEHERNEKHWLNEVRNVEVNRFTREIIIHPWPRGCEHDAQEDRADRQHNKRLCHHPRTFVRGLCAAPAIPKKAVDHLPRNIERRENDPRQHQVIRCMRSRPMLAGMKNFFLGPAAGEKEWNAAQCQHANGVRSKRHRHETAQTAHFAYVLFTMAPVNYGSRAEKQKRLEKTVRQ